MAVPIVLPRTVRSLGPVTFLGYTKTPPCPGHTQISCLVPPLPPLVGLEDSMALSRIRRDKDDKKNGDRKETKQKLTSLSDLGKVNLSTYSH